MKLLVILACILIPLFYILYYFGILVTRAGASLLSASYSIPSRWKGKFAGTTGFYRRNFVIFRKYSDLSIEVETDSGVLDFEVKAPDGSILSPASAVLGQDASILIDVSRFKRCSVILRMDHFNGQFCIALQ